MKKIINIILFLMSFMILSCSFLEEEEEKITKASFELSTIELGVGESKQVIFNIEPSSCISKADVKYSIADESDIVEIKNTSNNGCVITGKKNGNCVLIGKCSGFTSYLQVNVKGAVDIDPYIVVPYVVQEINPGDKISINVNLYNGSVADNTLFEFSNSDDSVINIESANNAVVVNAVSKGYSKITVHHDKAAYDATILIYVVPKTEKVCYISTAQNVVMAGLNDGTQNIKFNLVGSINNDLSLFSYEIVQGSEYLDLYTNNNICSVKPKKAGTSIIKISHPDTEISLEIQVIVVNTIVDTYIESDSNLVVIDDGKFKVVNCSLIGNNAVDEAAKYSYEVNNAGIINVSQVNSSFYIEPVKDGQAKIIVYNDYCNYPTEILVIVENYNQIIEQNYITTAQNVIKAEVGDEVDLSCLLIGGNEADKNSFIWTIDDSSVIDFITSFGKVNYSRSAAEFENILEVNGVIKCLKQGIATINVSNPKSSVDCVIKVKVYEKNTLANKVNISGEGLIKVLKGSNVNYSVKQISGETTTDFTWNMENTDIAAVYGNGLNSVINGKSSGITELNISNKDMINPFKATVISGTQAELDSTCVIYTDNKNISVFKDEVSYIEVKSSTDIDFDKYSISVNDKNVCEARMSGNTLIIKGLHSGNTEIVVSNEQSNNSLVIFIEVFDNETIDKPYYFTCEKFQGIVLGDTKEIEVTLNGAKGSSLDGITWEIEDSSVCQITGNGEKCRVKALKEGETVIKVSHIQSYNTANIVVYVCKTAEELINKKVVKVSKNNFISEIGESIYIEASINGDDIENIEWNVDDISIVNVDSNYNSAYIRCLSEGQAVVTVSYSNAVSQKIYISVKKQGTSLEKDFSIASILELVKGTNKTIELNTVNLSNEEINNIEWSCDNSNYIDIKGNGKTCYISVTGSGISNIYVKQKKLGIEKKIVVITADTYEELIQKYFISISKSYYKIGIGEQVDVSLVFGSKIPSDEIISDIKWNVSDSSIVQVNSNGKHCSFIGLEEGVSIIEVSGEGIANKITFTVVVGNNEVLEDYYIVCEKILGILNGHEDNLEMTLYTSEGKEVRTENNDFTYELEGDEDSIEINKIDNVLVIKALKTGKIYINVKHSLCSKAARVLVYTADTEEELNLLYPMTTDKDHYLIGINKSVNLVLNTVNDDCISDIKWNCSNTSVCRYEIGSSKKILKVTGKKEGTCIFTASHEGSDNVVFTVSVSEYGSIDVNVYMLSESIIGIVKGNEYSTSIQTNLSDEESQNIIWSSSDNSIVTCDGNGKECNLTAVKNGWCEVTARYNSTFYSTMIVYVCSDEQSLNNNYYFNVDRRYNYLNTQSSINIRPFFGNNIPQNIDITVQDVYANDVVDYEYSNGMLYVKGKNEGIALLKLTNSVCLNTVNLYFEVNNEIKGIISDTQTGYLTAVKTVYVLDADDTITPVEVECIPVGISEDNYSTIKWTAEDSSVISVVSDGKKAYIYANKEGETLLKAGSVYSSNILSFRIIVSSEEGVLIPYIKTDKSTLEIASGEISDITCEVINYPNYNIKRFSCESSDPSIFTADVTGNIIRVKGLENGQALLTVKYEDTSVQEKNIVVSVKGVTDGLIYMTTSDNYSIIPEGSNKTLSVNIIGYEEINSSTFNWEIVENKCDVQGQDVIRLSGSGNTRLCDALNPGIAKIMVTHSNGDNSALFPLYLYVKVTDYESSNPLYITTDNNILTVNEGGKNTVTVRLVNGDDSLNNQFVWNTSNTETLRINGAGNQCLVQGVKSGVGRITVSHPRCPGLNLDIVVIVEEDTSGETLYISTDSSIIEMKPTDSYKQINVTLNGGTAEQNTLFMWNILSFESTIKNKDGTSNSVISMNASQDTAIVKPLREGTAIIRVTNSATRHYIDIKVIVSLYNELKFSQSSLSVVQYETQTVDVEAPTGKTVIYESSNEKIATVTGTNKKCIIEGTGYGTCVIRAHTSDGTSSDEIIVSVSKNTTVVSSYISTSLNVLNMNVQEDVKGQVVKAVLNGTNVGNGDSDNIVWRISTGDTSIVRFLGTDTFAAKGSEIRIVPVSSGECSIVLSHDKAKNDKVIYVSVEQDNVSLKVSNDYVSMNINDKTSLSATLQNATEVEVENIVWKSLDTDIVKLYSAAEDGTVNGNTVILMSQKVGETIVQCSYGNITKNISIFVTEDPYIGFPEGSRIIGINQNIEVKLNVNPPQYYNQVEISTTSSIYATVTKRVDDENQEVYVVITGTQLEGKCTITAKLLDLVSTMDVTVTEDVTMKMKKSVLYQKDGTKEEKLNPGSLWMNNDCQKMRCYYTTSPAGLKFNNEEKIYKSSDLFNGSNKDYGVFPNNGQDCFSLTFGVDDTEENYPNYFEIIPISCFYGTLRLVNYEQNINVDVPLCSSYDEIKPSFIVEKTGNGKSQFDDVNNVINLAKGETLTIKADPGSLPVGMNVTYRYTLSNTAKVNVTNNGIISNKIGDFVQPSVNSKRQKTEYAGTLTVEVFYPKYCDVYGTYKKTFIVNVEEWY